MTVTLVIGAAASGKSAYAESLCLGHDGPRVYLATMEPFGEEGARRIARRARARGFPPSSARVTWAPQCPGFRAAARFFWRTWATWLRMSSSRKAACPHVTPTLRRARCSETSNGSLRPLRIRWRRALARVNAGVAARADRAVEVVCGIPVWMKGEGPTR